MRCREEDFRPFADTAIGMTEAITGNKKDGIRSNLPRIGGVLFFVI